MKNQKPIRASGKEMQSYVNYLLEDIQQAERKVNEGQDPFSCDEDLFDHFTELERTVLEDPLNTLGEICGLTKEQFPPAEKLSKRQIKMIVKAFYNLLHSWNLDVVIPKKFPEEKRYEFLVPLLDKKNHILKNGVCYIEFCEYEPKTCPFGIWCDCKDLYAERLKQSQKKKSRRTKSSPQ